MSDLDKPDAKLFSEYQQRPYHSEFGGASVKKTRTKSLLTMLYEQAEVDSYIAEHQYGGAVDAHSTLYSENTPGSKGLKYFDLDKMAGVCPSQKSLSGVEQKDETSKA